jgi:hypothetical protein
MSAELIIMDDKQIGRHFQAATIGYVLDVLPKELQDKLIKGFVEGSVTLSEGEVSTLVDSIAEKLSRLCESKRAQPKLYVVGGTVNDYETLSKLAPRKPLVKTKDDKAKGSMPSLCKWLVEASMDVKSKPTAELKLPIFLRAYVFSKFRDIGDVEKAKVNALTLYVATAGSIVSIIASDLKRGEASYELFLVPGTSESSLKNAGRLYTLLHLKARNLTIEDIIKEILKNESLSYELCILLAIAIHIYNAAILVEKMPSLASIYNVLEEFKLINITPNQRPLVTWEHPLTLTHLYSELEKHEAGGLLLSLYDSITSANRYSGSVERAKDAVAQCVTGLFAYIETKSLEPLLLCVANAQRIMDKFRELNLSDAERSFMGLIKEIARLTTR